MGSVTGSTSAQGAGDRSRSAPEDEATAGSRRLRRPVVLVGMMGSGKTAVGRVVAQRLGAPFLDSDAAIETAAQATIPEIFARDGEAFFRDREAEVIARLLKSGPAVLSTGGGAYGEARNRAAIARHGAALWLDVPLDLLWERVRHKDTRPLLRTADPRATLAALLDKRLPFYAEAELRVPVLPQYSVEDTALRAIEALAARPDILG